MIVKLGSWSPQSATKLKSYERLDHASAMERLVVSASMVERIVAMDEAEGELAEQVPRFGRRSASELAVKSRHSCSAVECC